MTACGSGGSAVPDARVIGDDAGDTIDAAVSVDALVHNCDPTTTQQLLAAFADDTCTTVTIAAGTSHGHFVVARDVTIVGAGIGDTILAGGQTGSVLTLSGPTTTSVSQLTIQNGSSQGGGGGIYASTSLSVTDVDFENNVARAVGGAIFIGFTTDVGDTLTILRGTFANNSVQAVGSQGSGQGGAVFVRRAAVSITDSTFTSNEVVVDGGAGEAGAVYVSNASTVDIESSTFSTNSLSTATQSGDGGALTISDCTTVTIDGSQFLNNTATATTGPLNGGAVDIYASSVSPVVNLSGDAFIGNRVIACGVRGGALAIDQSAVTGTALTFMNNQAIGSALTGGANYANGGAISSGSTNSGLAVADSTFSANSATLNASDDPTVTGNANGGGLSVYGSLSLTDVVISGNTVTNNAGTGVNGGGFYASANIATISIFNSSIVNNTAALAFTSTNNTFISGGGAYISSQGSGDCQVEFANTFVAENQLSEPNGQGSILLGPQLDLEAYDSSLLTVAFSNATLSTDEGSTPQQVFQTYMGGTSMIGLDFANTILDAHNDNDGCSESSGISVVSSGYNLMSANCLPTPSAGDVILSEATGDPASDLTTQQTTQNGDLVGFPYYAINESSPAFQGGNPAGCKDAEGNLLITDGLGQPRFGNCDIGAYEVQPLPP